MELEAIEPDLFLPWTEDGRCSFARAMAAAVRA
jgi:hypothetical protein